MKEEGQDCQEAVELEPFAVLEPVWGDMFYGEEWLALIHRQSGSVFYW